MSTLGNDLLARYYAQQEALPFGYERVTYLESTGTQYINSIVAWDKSLNVIAKVCGLQQTTFAICSFFGARDLNAANAGYAFGFSMNNRFVSDNSGSRVISSMSYVLGDVYIVDKGQYETIIKSSSQTETLTNTPGTQTATKSLILFGLNNAGTIVPTASRFYYCIIKNDLAPIRNFVPCVRKSDNKPGMYDLCKSICPLTGTPFYINAGAGEFVTP